MPAPTLDVSSGESAALADYCSDRTVRGVADYIQPGESTCILCGPIGSCTQAAVHLHSKAHRSRVSSYYACLQSLYALQAADLAQDDGNVSRRETILAWLGNRIRESVVTGGLSTYNHAAVAFLLRRRETHELLHAFKEIRGGPVPGNKGMCTICMERHSTVMFESCRHICACCVCAARLPGHGDDDMRKQCPICRVRTTTCTVFIV